MLPVPGTVLEGIMEFDQFWESLPFGAKKEFAAACGWTSAHLGEIARRNRKPSSFEVVLAIERESGGLVNRSSWPRNLEDWMRIPA